MDRFVLDVAHLFAGGLVLVSFMLLYQDRMFGLLNTFALHALVVSLSVAWQAYIQLAPHLYITAAIALLVKAIIIPVALHRIIVRLGIHRTIETVVGIGQTMLATFEDPMFETNTRLDIEVRPETLRNDVLRERFRQQLEFWRKSLVVLLEEARDKGELRRDIDIDTFVVLAIAAYDGLRGWGLIDPQIFRPREVFDLLMDLVSSKNIPGDPGHALN